MDNTEVELTAEERQARINDVELMLELVAHPGWTILQKQYQEAYDMQDSIINIPDERALYAAQGRLLTLRQILDTRDTLLLELEWLEGEGDEDNGEGHLEDFADEFLRKVEDE